MDAEVWREDAGGRREGGNGVDSAHATGTEMKGRGPRSRGSGRGDTRKSREREKNDRP